VPPSDPEAPAADKLQRVARSLINKAEQGDASAIKQVLDKIDSNTVASAPKSDDGSAKMNVSWGKPK
jgi:hypothetical protein